MPQLLVGGKIYSPNCFVIHLRVKVNSWEQKKGGGIFQCFSYFWQVSRSSLTCLRISFTRPLGFLAISAISTIYSLTDDELQMTFHFFSSSAFLPYSVFVSLFSLHFFRWKIKKNIFLFSWPGFGEFKSKHGKHFLCFRLAFSSPFVFPLVHGHPVY